MIQNIPHLIKDIQHREISKKYDNNKKELTTALFLYQPVHVTPFPLYPVLQAQVNDPSVLEHAALL